ncbi:hypothetical protein CRV12_03250 [Candidatus Pantoea edessiphila]|uniref:Rhodanese domain-containing protein n=1 Tax=Candidatus Pantoea edessiphila TaxID=2044610 RepID=A0A2P5SZE9_9GAMM|nr:hypothetical protein CRV12_03250 [Candidatus Pantoea edessiphila]
MSFLRKIVVKLETVLCLKDNEVIIDIRSIDEQKNKPLVFKNNNIKIKSIPFYNLNTKFKKLDQNITWLLYCDSGVMSRLQALYLIEQGFYNVKIYEPSQNILIINY